MQGLAEAAGYMLGVGQALWQVGCALSDQGLWAEAEAPLRRSLALLEAQLHPDHPDLACVCNGARLCCYQNSLCHHTHVGKPLVWGIQSAKHPIYIINVAPCLEVKALFVGGISAMRVCALGVLVRIEGCVV